ncbi:MAG TPA: hypothetical protein VGD24_05885 [Gallionella sp.]
MDAIVMKMSGSDARQVAVAAEEYGDEVMSAGWNPQLEMAGEFPVAPLNQHINLLADLAGMDVDTFMKRLYECQG